MRKRNAINCDRNLTRDVDYAFGTPQAQREAYRANCTMRRNGNRIEKLKKGHWILNWEYKSINAAKRQSREVSVLANLYAV